MIIRFETSATAAGPPVVDERDDFGRFHVEVAGDGDVDAAVSTFGRLDDDGDHAWISVQAIREATSGPVDEGWEQRFQGMLDYAGSKGWLDEDRAAIRAHIERV